MNKNHFCMNKWQRWFLLFTKTNNYTKNEGVLCISIEDNGKMLKLESMNY